MNRLCAVLALLIITACGLSAQEAPRIGSVDALHIYRTYWKTRELIYDIDRRKT